MDNQDPPKEVNEYLNLSSEELSGKLLQFKEALESENGKDIKTAEVLGLEVSKNEEPKPEVKKMTPEEVLKLQEVINYANEKLKEGGISTDIPTLTKMSEVEKQLADKQEKMAQAKFGEQITELTALDEHLDVELIKSLNMETEDKVIVASLVKTIASPYLSSIEKLGKELESANKEAESLAKFKAPVPEEIDGKTSIEKAKAKFGLKSADSEKEKTE